MKTGCINIISRKTALLSNQSCWLTLKETCQKKNTGQQVKCEGNGDFITIINAEEFCYKNEFHVSKLLLKCNK